METNIDAHSPGKITGGVHFRPGIKVHLMQRGFHLVPPVAEGSNNMVPF